MFLLLFVIYIYGGVSKWGALFPLFKVSCLEPRKELHFETHPDLVIKLIRYAVPVITNIMRTIVHIISLLWHFLSMDVLYASVRLPPPRLLHWRREMMGTSRNPKERRFTGSGWTGLSHCMSCRSRCPMMMLPIKCPQIAVVYCCILKCTSVCSSMQWSKFENYVCHPVPYDIDDRKALGVVFGVLA